MKSLLLVFLTSACASTELQSMQELEHFNNVQIRHLAWLNKMNSKNIKVLLKKNNRLADIVGIYKIQEMDRQAEVVKQAEEKKKLAAAPPQYGTVCIGVEEGEGKKEKVQEYCFQFEKSR